MKEKIKKKAARKLTKRDFQITLEKYEEHRKAKEEIIEKYTKREIQNMIKIRQEGVEEMKEALQHNVEWPSEKQGCETALASLRQKKGWFANRMRKHIKRKLEKSINKPPQKLSKDNREFLKKRIEKDKRIIASLKECMKSKN